MVLLTQKISSHAERLGCKDSLQHASRFKNVSSQGSGVFRHSWLALPSLCYVVHDGIRRKICTTVTGLLLVFGAAFVFFEIISVSHMCLWNSCSPTSSKAHSRGMAACCWTNCLLVAPALLALALAVS